MSLLEAPVTVGTFVLAVTLMAWGGVTTWRHRTVPRAAWLGLQATGWLFYAFVWKHFYDFGVSQWVAAGEVPGSVPDNLRRMLREDVVADYFALFGRAGMRARHMAFWLFEIRDLTLVVFTWMVVEVRRRGGGWLSALGWLHVAFLSTLAGSMALFLGAHTRRPRSGEASTALVGVFAVLLAVCTVNSLVGLTDVGMSIQITLMFSLALAPLARGAGWPVGRLYLALAGFALADRLFGLAAAFASGGTDTPRLLLDAALYDPVIFGTISGELLNAVALLAVVLALATRRWRLALLPVLATATIGLAAGVALLLWRRERAAAWVEDGGAARGSR